MTGLLPRTSGSGSETSAATTAPLPTSQPDRADLTRMDAFPRLRLRDPAIDLVELPWERPLGEWSSETLSFRIIPVGPSRHLVRFLVSGGILYALKELPL